MPWHLKTQGDQVLVVRDRDQKVVGRHKDRKKATAQLRVLYSLEKAKFASRTEAARYAANQRWKNHQKKENKTSGSTKDAIIEAFPLMMKVNSTPWAKGDSSHFEMLVEEGVSEKSAKLATSDNITLGDYGDPAVAAGNCGIASADAGAFLIRAGIAKEGEVFMREVGEPAYGDMGGTHFVLQVGPKDSSDAIIVDLTLRQFDSGADFPWIGTVEQYRETGYETDDIVGPEMGTDMDPIDASGNVLYPGYEKLTSK
jgi:hypothetical protein